MIPQIEPWLDEEELREVTDAMKSGWLTEHDRTKRFEELFKEYTGAKYALTVSNGTVSLYMALLANNICPGDEVLVPGFTFVATLNSVMMAGAKPVLVDVDKRTFNMDPAEIADKMTDRTKAIMPVHIYGQSADMDAINRVAGKNRLAVVEDAAQGVGATFNGKHVGLLGSVGSFSFYGNKTITTGEGGMIITDDEKMYRKCWMLKNHGREKTGVFIHPTVGFNFRITELQAAIGIAQMSKLDRIISMKQKIRDIYAQNLESCREVSFTYTDSRCRQVFWFTNILVENPKVLADHLMKQGIQTRRFFYPVNKQPCYDFKESMPNSEYAYDHGLSLPSSALLKQDQIEFICRKIKEFYQ